MGNTIKKGGFMKHRCFISAILMAVLLAVFLVSCSKSMLKTKPPLGEYVSVEFKKLITPMFIDDYKDKYVKVSCKFLMASRIPGGFSDTDYFAFQAKSPSEYTPEFLTVIGPKRLADVYLTLRDGDKITLYGEMIQLRSRSISGAQHRELALVADQIEK
jgi:hypothetical protein